MAKIVNKWEDKRFMAELAGKVLQGMDAATDFAVGAARGLAPVRSGIMKSEITKEVRVDGDDVIGAIGMPKKGTAFWARFVELGTRKMAAQPFLRPAVFNNAATIVKLICGGV